MEVTAEFYLEQYKSEIKQLLAIPEEAELKIIEKKYYVLMVYSEEPYSLFCGNLKDVKRFIVHLVKASYIRGMNKGLISSSFKYA